MGTVVIGPRRPPLDPWRIYVENLVSLGYGYPLWPPQFNADVGDVGYIAMGRFVRLFNVLKENSQSSNNRGLPENFSVLDQPEYARGAPSVVHSPRVPECGKVLWVSSSGDRYVETTH